MAMGMGPLEILIMLLAGSGGQAPDMISLIDAESYFKWRNVPITTAKMVELAQTDPSDAKAQLGQLLALQILHGQADKLMKDPNYLQYRQVLESLAQGKKAQDPFGFARRHAGTVLDKVDGHQVKQKFYHLTEGLTWFPVNVTLVGSYDIRNKHGQVVDLAPLRAGIFAKLPKEVKEKVFEAAEELGNVELDRVAFAYEEKSAKKGWIRLSGKFPQRRIIALTKKYAGKFVDFQTRETKNEAITTLEIPGEREAPTFMLVGDTEMVVAIAADKQVRKAMLDQVLAVRGTQEHAGMGGLKTRLEQVSPRAAYMVVGQVPATLARELTRGGPLTIFPKFIVGQLLPTPFGMDLDIKGDLDNGDDTAKFVQEVGKLRKEALDGLAQLKNQNLPIPLPFAAIEKTVESMQIQAQGNQALFRMLISNELLRGFTPLFMRELGGANPGLVLPPTEQSSLDRHSDIAYSGLLPRRRMSP